ncbi:TPA: FKBP-type peptidyl-prolyl cis-trans isomerase N-terminal domain-containing protein [Serratia marcescens]
MSAAVAGKGRLRRLVALLPLLWCADAARADDGVPALLQFAEQYRNDQSPPTSPEGAGGHQGAAATTPASKSKEKPRPATVSVGDGALRRTLAQREAQINQQKATLREQEKQLAALRQALTAAENAARSQPETRPSVKTADFAPLRQMVRQLSTAMQGTPDAQRSAELITEARRQAEHDRQALTDSQAQVRALKVQLGDMKAQLQRNSAHEQQAQSAALTVLQQKLDAGEQTLVALQQRADAAEKQREALTAERGTLRANVAKKEAEVTALDKEKSALQQAVTTAQARQTEQEQMVLRLQGDLNALRERAKWLVTSDILQQPAGRQAYAAGGALGRDILSILDERKAWGVSADRQTVLAGVIDAFSGQYQLTTDVLAKALEESETMVNQARERSTAVQQKKGDAFVAEFRKKKGVKQSPSGFWYRVDYAGDAAIVNDALIDVVVKESLTDGTVIQDMEVTGKVLSQPLKDYPPLFREAIGLLKNHGSLTMVVPPALAYGEAGYPPSVPPNATMVYTLRIDDSRPAEQR